SSNDTFVAWNRQNLVTSCLNCTGLMACNVSIICCDNTLIWAQNRRNRNQVCLGSSYQEMDISILSATRFTNQLTSCVTVMVCAVTRKLFHIGLYHSFQNFWMSAFYIVTMKINHRSLS